MGVKFLPNLFILGAAKCATSTLHSYLEMFPDVCMSRPKEPFYFEAYYERGLSFYQKEYFEHWKGEKIIGEARHRNLILPFVPPRIFEINPDSKLIVIIRNPTDRAYSHWYHNYSRHSEPLSFKNAIKEDFERIKKGLDCSTSSEIDQHIAKLPRPGTGRVIGLGLYRTYIDSGYYLNQIKRYLSIFPQSSLIVLRFEDVQHRPNFVLSKLGEFLETSPIQIDENQPVWINPSKSMPADLVPFKIRAYNRGLRILHNVFGKRGSLVDPYNYLKDEETIEWLNKHFKDHNDRLSDFLKIDLSDWN